MSQLHQPTNCADSHFGISRDEPNISVPYEGLATQGANGFFRWTGEVRLIEKHLFDPLRWKRPRRIFVNSMSDLFHERVPDDWITRIFAVMSQARHHTFQVLTKRADRMRDYLERAPYYGKRVQWGGVEDRVLFDHTITQHILPNVWLGVSVENQRAADERIPELLATPAAIRWLSCEPLLGPLNLRQPHPGLVKSPQGLEITMLHGLDWVVVGGESGPNARPTDAAWVSDLRDQCRFDHTPFFFKQWGEWLPALQDGAPGDDQWINASDDPIRVGKKRAGRLLDGREWNEYPRERVIA